MIGIIDIGMGNLRSVENAVYEQGFDPIRIDAPEQFDEATHVILPGVGHFSTAMKALRSHGLVDALAQFALEQKKPLLGICLGMQLLLSHSEEGDTSGLNFIEGEVRRFSGINLRVPHVGWNELVFESQHPVLSGLKSGDDFYFVHSYFASTQVPSETITTTEYGSRFASVVSKNNIVGIQFHPEKSQAKGLQIIENFCDWDGSC
jgi:glutamine amidotransferase